MQHIDRATGKNAGSRIRSGKVVFANGEFGDSMNHGPGHARQQMRIAGGQAAFALRGFHQST
jgi:hypothetical protein